MSHVRSRFLRVEWFGARFWGKSAGSGTVLNRRVAQKSARCDGDSWLQRSGKWEIVAARGARLACNSMSGVAFTIHFPVY